MRLDIFSAVAADANFVCYCDTFHLDRVDNERHSTGSAYSPTHGMFTTRSVAVSEAGISSPDAACLHLQENLERVKEVGRGASSVVHKAIHIPTLKVVAVKVSIYIVLEQVYGFSLTFGDYVSLRGEGCTRLRPRSAATNGS